MEKRELIIRAQDYCENTLVQKGYVAGFQAACNIIRQKINEYHNSEFCNEMEKLSEVAYMDFSMPDFAKLNKQ